MLRDGCPDSRTSGTESLQGELSRGATTRRGFFAAAAAALASGIAPALADEDEWEGDDEEGEPESEEPPVDLPLVNVPPEPAVLYNDEGVPYGMPDADGNVSVIASFMDIMDEVDYRPEATYTLPVGCVVYASCDSRAAVVERNSDNRTFTRLGCLDYATGEYSILLEQAISGKGYAVSEARITDYLVAWVEMNNSTEDWVLYACRYTGEPLSAGSSGLVRLAEADGDWLPAQFDVMDSLIAWQVMPDPYGPYSREHSHAYLWTLGAPQGNEVWDSPGRFACAPNFSEGILTLAPRVKADEGVYYGITALDVARGMAQLDQLVMPASVKPFFATYVGSNFAFSVEADYGYGGRLGNMGYYIGPGEGPYHYVSREPSAQINNVGGLYVVKSRLSYFVVDLERLTYARISAANGCTDYGDFPATAGSVRRFVTYATVKDSSTGMPSSVLVRIFSLA